MQVGQPAFGLVRVSERLLQLARAEGGRLRLETSTDMRTVARVIVEDIGRTDGPGRIVFSLAERPVMSDLDPDAFAILCRNLIENALRHGDPAAPVEVTLSPDGTLTVANDGPSLPPEVLARLTDRFERAGTSGGGSGLGLAIVDAIAKGSQGELQLRSPIPGRTGGFVAEFHLPN